MRRVLLLVLGVMVLTVPAAHASDEPCWKRVILDWYDNGRLDRTWKCDCVRKAIAHLPVDGYARPVAIYARSRQCDAAARQGAQQVVVRQATPAKHHRNIPALVTSTILAVVVTVLLLWRRRQARDRRRILRR